jgi:hypothetical protein
VGIFDSKHWNSEVFLKYLETIPKVKTNAFINAGVFRNRGDLKARLVDQVGGNYITEPIIGRIGGDALNYDGSTNITTSGLETYTRGMKVHGRAKGWKEYDFTVDITGKNFMEEIAKQVSDYWDDVNNTTILNILKGIFATARFANNTYDITSAGTTTVSATTLNNAIQKASGENKNQFKLVIMHSQVATNLENQKLLDYWKYTDADGVERNSELASWNGRTVIIDDSLVERVETTAGVYQVAITTKATAGDKIKINNVELVAGTDFSLSTDTATGNAATIAAALNASTDASVNKFTWSNSSGTLVATEDIGYYGLTGGFTATATKATGGTLVIGTVSNSTVAVAGDVYSTYILGTDAFDYCDCGVKIPSEVYRDPKTSGGYDELITRQRKLYAPKGFSFINTSLISPTDEQFATAANWDLAVSSGGVYYPTKAIPIARIKSTG